MEKFIQENMKIIRNILGYTQTELADRLGITRPYLGKIESGDVEMQRTLAMAFMTLVICKTSQFSNESMEYRLMSVYINKFENIMMEII